MFLTLKLCTHAKLNFLKIKLSIYIKMDLALNNLQRLICHKTQPTNKPTVSKRHVSVLCFGAFLQAIYALSPILSTLYHF